MYEQVLQYDIGDFYRQHHDQNAHPHSPWGPRLYTFFIYLSNVPEGVRARLHLASISPPSRLRRLPAHPHPRTRRSSSPPSLRAPRPVSPSA